MTKESLDNTAHLASVREHIDAVDAELLRLLNHRATLSLEVGRLKARESEHIFKPQRERAVLDTLIAQNSRDKGHLHPEHIHAIWREIFVSSRALQKTSYNTENPA